MEGDSDDFPHWKKYSEELEVNNLKISPIPNPQSPIPNPHL